MTSAGISQPTWKCTPSSLISAHWLMTVSTRKPKIRDGKADLEREADLAAAGRLLADLRPGLAYPVQE